MAGRPLKGNLPPSRARLVALWVQAGRPTAASLTRPLARQAGYKTNLDRNFRRMIEDPRAMARARQLEALASPLVAQPVDAVAEVPPGAEPVTRPVVSADSLPPASTAEEWRDRVLHALHAILAFDAGELVDASGQPRTLAEIPAEARWLLQVETVETMGERGPASATKIASPKLRDRIAAARLALDVIGPIAEESSPEGADLIVLPAKELVGRDLLVG